MKNFLQYLARRLIAIPVTLLIVTLLLYGVAAMAPPEVRAKLYWPKNASEEWMALVDPEKVRKLNERIIEQYGLNDPFLAQYGRWISNLLRGDWGSSYAGHDVLAALLARTPMTAELTLYSALFLIPMGLVSGVIAGWRRNRAADLGFRFGAFVATSIPPFILALLFLVIFYVSLGWFPPGRFSLDVGIEIASKTSTFRSYTGMTTIDGLLNGRIDITLDALKHLILPVVTLSLVHWATLGRVTRASMIEELGQQYVTAARGKGLASRDVIWLHAFRNAIVPGLSSIAVAVASLISGVFIIERVFDLSGISELVVLAVGQTDLPLTLGITIFSVLFVLPLMFILDILLAVVDPRIREGGI